MRDQLPCFLSVLSTVPLSEAFRAFLANDSAAFFQSILRLSHGTLALFFRMALFGALVHL